MLILCSLGCVRALVIYMGKLSVEKVCDDERLRRKEQGKRSEQKVIGRQDERS